MTGNGRAENPGFGNMPINREFRKYESALGFQGGFSSSDFGYLIFFLGLLGIFLKHVA